MSNTDIVDIQGAFDAALGTWAAAYPIEVQWANSTKTPVVNTLYLQAKLLPAPTQSPSFGAAHIRYTGIYQILVYAPMGAGVGAANAVCDSIMDLFPQGTMLAMSRGRITLDRYPSQGGGIQQNGWFVTPMSVQYRADVLLV